MPTSSFKTSKLLSLYFLYLNALLLRHISVLFDLLSDKDVFRRFFSSHNLGNCYLWMVFDVLYHQVHQGEASRCPNIIGRNPPTNAVDLDDGKLHDPDDDIIGDLGIQVLCYCMDLWLWNLCNYLPEFHSFDDLCSDKDWIDVLPRGC